MSTPTPTSSEQLWEGPTTLASPTTPDTSSITSSRNSQWETYGWTVSRSSDTPLWDAITYDGYDRFNPEVLYTSANFWDLCTYLDHDHTDPTPRPLSTGCAEEYNDCRKCEIGYTACSNGTIYGVATSSPCHPDSSILAQLSTVGSVDLNSYSCLTDLYYPSYGAQTAFSRFGCASFGLSERELTVYGASPTVNAALAAPTEWALNSDPETKKSTLNPGHKAAIAIAVFIVLISIAIAVFYYRNKRKWDPKRRPRLHDVDEELQDSTAGRGQEDGLPRYGVAAEENASGQAGDGMAPPPPYRP
ncbi:hypothetical protein M011DRAFT_463851 [Sporormia fimetaria CBS 119925]|uniref:Uncharacterized protein n=1 Tax=Sporormia fimetaria CBS 119925 TaxID=1340428 RepID=A0A6A6VMS5_9PLEO|nr:hypothetical protein M011DRAFT_463851 [Sporormia fimetaria CBS 119925]